LLLGGIAAIAIAPISAPLASLCTSAVRLAHGLLVGSIAPFSHFAFATFRVPHYADWHVWLYAAYYLPLVGWAILIDRWRPVDTFFAVERAQPGQSASSQTEPAIKRPRRGLRSMLSRHRKAMTCGLALALTVLAVIRPLPLPLGRKLTVHFLDVGQGDSALLEFPQGTTMLVDSGGELRFDSRRKKPEPSGADAAPAVAVAAEPVSDPASDPASDTDDTDFREENFAVGEAVVSRFLWSERRRHLDFALVTHADADHIGGFHEVLQNFAIDDALVGHRAPENSQYRRFSRLAARRHVPVDQLVAGDRFSIDGVQIEVLWPPPPSTLPVTSKNNDSVVLRLIYGSTSILLAGDIEEPAEAALVKSGADLRADLLKVPHHGSKTSSTEAFLDCVRPATAVISVGERSRFGHPHRTVVERYQSRGIRLLQTGRVGMVTAESDGSQVLISTYRRGYETTDEHR
jgi:competence protein ComEC